jgi:hypothetical protein
MDDCNSPVPFPFLWTLHWSDLIELLLIFQNFQPSKLIRLTNQQFMRICTISIQHTHQHYQPRFPGVITKTLLDNTQVSRTLTCNALRDTLAQEGGFVETTFTKTRIMCLNMSNTPLVERAMASQITPLHLFGTSQPCDVN